MPPTLGLLAAGILAVGFAVFVWLRRRFAADRAREAAYIAAKPDYDSPEWMVEDAIRRCLEEAS